MLYSTAAAVRRSQWQQAVAILQSADGTLKDNQPPSQDAAYAVLQPQAAAAAARCLVRRPATPGGFTSATWWLHG
jgi:hypothetical protein